ncbi:MAG: malto-oligosyltrehalose synthase [Actinomycetales bacterium]|nr:malto-oligosyltrehalose synthase [Actinomycetales bacterium]
MSSPRVPASTYRLQLHPKFGFAQVAEQAAYLESLGVSHVYLSPILQAGPGSTHGYDVVDHTRINRELGGRDGFEAMVATLHAHGLGVVLDLVPNHMSLPTPAHLNAPLWQLLAQGPDGPSAAWFDVDWPAGGGRILMPLLGTDLDEALAAGELTVDKRGGPSGDAWVVRYHEHELPVRLGTEALALPELLEAQWWRLAYWKVGDRDLNYRRFFNVATLVAVRVEDPAVFAATHAEVLDLVRAGLVDGLRIDHPDGLADPRDYLRHLRGALTDAGGAWLVVEKILEGQERLPTDWPVDGTTGYDTLKRIGGVFIDPSGAEPLLALHAILTGDARGAEEVAREAKMQKGLLVQAAEVARLVRLLTRVCAGFDAVADAQPERLSRALSALLVSMDRYRAYVHLGEPVTPESTESLRTAAAWARDLLDVGDHEVLELVVELALDMHAGLPHPQIEAARREFVVRFQQTCGPIQAKGIEDTAFYRWLHLTALNEVGGNPGEFATAPDKLVSNAAVVLEQWPATMTTLTTHDTKRSEDTRAALSPLSELPIEWSVWMHHALELALPVRPLRPKTPDTRGVGVDLATDYLLWQTLVATAPITAERLEGYAVKAVREAARHTNWDDPDAAYERALSEAIAGVLGSAALVDHVRAWQARTAEHVRAVTLGQKLLQLIHPGVPDVYQGTELLTRTLVDPDNRAGVDFADRRERLARLDGGGVPADLSDEKLLVTARALRLRRAHPGWFGAGSEVLLQGATSPHCIALGRGARGRVEVVAVATRLVEGLAAAGGWGEHVLEMPEGQWHDLLSGQVHLAATGGLPIADVLASLPVALLVRTG